MSLLAERLLLGKAVVSTKVTDLELKLVRETVANAQVFKIDNVATVSYTHLTLPTNREV